MVFAEGRATAVEKLCVKDQTLSTVLESQAW